MLGSETPWGANGVSNCFSTVYASGWIDLHALFVYELRGSAGVMRDE
jgi:hypothetical protein